MGAVTHVHWWRKIADERQGSVRVRRYRCRCGEEQKRYTVHSRD